MAERVKFLFDTSFEHGTPEPRARQPERPAAVFTEADMAAARQESFEAGRAAGEAQAQAASEVVAAQTLTAIAETLSGLEARRTADTEQMHREATALAYTIGSKLACTLMQRVPTAEIEALLKRCLAELREEPRVVVRASESAVGAIKPRLEAIVASSGFAGHVVLVPDEMLSGANCRVEWADGGAERDAARLMARIEAVVQRFLQPASA